VSNAYVFKGSGHLWARRRIIVNAIGLLCPPPNDETESNEARTLLLNRSVTAAVRACPNFARVLQLNPFERFIFVMSILEKYSVHECSLLLGCLRRDVIDARSAAIQRLVSLAIATETEPQKDVTAFAEVNCVNH
jgi:hypothetical protein